jgi:hypothetical protein
MIKVSLQFMLVVGANALLSDNVSSLNDAESNALSHREPLQPSQLVSRSIHDIDDFDLF